jgi:trimeric autotransporter adhesin
MKENMKTTNIKSFGQPALRLGFCLALVLTCFWLLPGARATDLDGVLANGNTADGLGVLTNLTTGHFNTGSGWYSLASDQTGSWNTAFGIATLYHNDSGQDNTAVGVGALFYNTIGNDNTAYGFAALFNNQGGYFNTAIGEDALSNNYEGYENTATGFNALGSNTYGVRNTAVGVEALLNNVGDLANGNYNTAVGFQALRSSRLNNYNTAIGAAALYRSTGSANIAVGFNAGVNLTTGDLNINIGNTGLAGESRTIRIGTQEVQTATYIGGIFNAVIADGAPVLVGADGHLGTLISSARFKKDIRAMDKASEEVLALQPVTFHYKTDSKCRPQFGLIAEDVAEVNPDLVVRDEKGEIYTVRYEAVNAMLLNEFLKEHRKVEEQQVTIAELRSTVAQERKDFEAIAAEQGQQIQALTATLKEQASQIQKVSAQIELGRPAPRTVLNYQ